MIRNLLATTAVATLLASGAFAQTQPAPAEPAAPAATEAAPAPTGPAPKAAEVAPGVGQLASNLIGETVYNGTGDDAENIGDVNDLVIGEDGGIDAIVVGVGGFLGIGEKRVALNYEDIEWAERDGERWIVVSATADQLKELPEFDTAAYNPEPAADSTAMAPAPAGAGMSAGEGTVAPAPAPADTAVAPAPAETDATAEAPADAPADTTAEAPAATDAPADTAADAPAATDTETTAAIDRSTLQPLDTAEISAEEFVGTTVYGANDEMVGEIGDVVMQGDKVDAIIIDVGGFLGLGEKPVAVGLDNLKFMTDADGDRYLYTEWTKEQLEAQVAYDEGAYAEKRDEMRMVVPN